MDQQPFLGTPAAHVDCLADFLGHATIKPCETMLVEHVIPFTLVTWSDDRAKTQQLWRYIHNQEGNTHAFEPEKLHWRQKQQIARALLEEEASLHFISRVLDAPIDKVKVYLRKRKA